MKYFILTCILVLGFYSCKKVDVPRLPENESFGEITFNEVPNTMSIATVGSKSNFRTLKVYSVMTAPNGSTMQTRIFACNDLSGSEFRSLEIIINGGFDDFPTENPNVIFTYSKGVPTNVTGLYNTQVVNNQLTYTGVRSFYPAFFYPTGTFPSRITSVSPIIFSQFSIDVPNDQRRISASIPSLTFGFDVLENFEMNINSYGGTLLPYTKCMTFEVDGKFCGSFENTLMRCTKPESNKPGINQIKGTFTSDSRNPIEELTIDFVHHSSRLAYNGPVGKFDLLDGTGYTEIKITALDQNGKIYREQKGKGFVKTYYEKPWFSFFDGVSNVERDGFILLAFEAELKSDDGSIIKIENGNAHYITSRN
jgi:hypothetical protein